MEKIVSAIFILVFFASCANHVEEDDRIEQVYNFSSITVVFYDDLEAGGTSNDITGEIKFSKNSIDLYSKSQTESSNDHCTIKSVTYGEDPNILTYRTNIGKFEVEMESDTIRQVSLSAKNDFTIFHIN